MVDADNSFDIVYCQATLVMNLIKDFKKIISEMIRVAKKRVVIIEPHSIEASKNGEYYSHPNYLIKQRDERYLKKKDMTRPADENHRLIANYKFLEDMGYKVIFKKMPPELCGGEEVKPWGMWGYIITIDL